jgi:hypothetical protein
MLNKVSPALSKPENVWDQIDHRLLDYKLAEIAEEMHAKIAGDRAKAHERYQVTADLDSYLEERVRCEESCADEWADKQCHAALEVWKTQGNKPSPVFFGTVFDWLLSFFFSRRLDAVSAEIASEFMLTDRRVKSRAESAVQKFARAIVRLNGRWKGKMEVAAIESEYEAQPATISDSPQINPVASPAPSVGTAGKPRVTQHSSKGSDSQQGIPSNSPAAMPQPFREKKPTSSGHLLLKYRSEIKRAILIQLTKNPRASDLEICRSLDDEGPVELPESWKRKPEDWCFVGVYMDPSLGHRIEIAISKIRADLRERGLLPER